MLNIDKYAYASKLKQRDPLEKLTFALLTQGVCLWADWIVVSITVLSVMAWVSVRKGGTPFPVFIKLMLVPVFFLILGILTIAFRISEDSRQFIFSIPVLQGHLGVSKTGLISAAGLFWKALGSISCLYYLALSTPIADILAVLRRLKCPLLLVELMGLVYRFVFVLLETANNILTAQNSRLGYGSLASGYRSIGALAATLFIRAYKRSDELYTALEARGYEGELNVLLEPYPKQWKRYFIALAINVSLVIITLIFKE